MLLTICLSVLHAMCLDVHCGHCVKTSFILLHVILSTCFLHVLCMIQQNKVIWLTLCSCSYYSTWRVLVLVRIMPWLYESTHWVPNLVNCCHLQQGKIKSQKICKEIHHFTNRPLGSFQVSARGFGVDVVGQVVNAVLGQVEEHGHCNIYDNDDVLAMNKNRWTLGKIAPP